MPTNFARIEAVADFLRGTANSLEKACNIHGFKENDLTAEEYERLDELIFECEECNWWCDDGERSQIVDGACDECWQND